MNSLIFYIKKKIINDFTDCSHTSVPVDIHHWSIRCLGWQYRVTRDHCDGEEDGWLLWRECDGRLTADQHNEHPLHRHRRGRDVNKEELTMYSDNASYFGGMYLLIFHMKTQNTRKMLRYVVRCTLCRSRKVFIMEMWLEWIQNVSTYIYIWVQNTVDITNHHIMAFFVGLKMAGR